MDSRLRGNGVPPAARAAPGGPADPAPIVRSGRHAFRSPSLKPFRKGRLF